jgi:hypothetical protein
MKFYWQQLSPKEREVLLRHFLLKRNLDAPVTAERVCAALQKTHSLSCHTSAQGKAVIQFVTHKAGVRSGTSLADDLAEGIYKAALRAKGVELEDGLVTAAPLRRGRRAVSASAAG